MTLNEYTNKIEKLTANFNTILMNQIVQGKYAEDLAQDIRTRSRGGKDAEGGEWPKYSTGFLLLRKSMIDQIGSGNYNNAMKEAIWVSTKGGKKWPLLPGGYKRLREISGRQTDHKDFSFTGAMWKDFGTKEITPTDKNIKIVQKGKTEQNKLDWNSEKVKKSIIEPSKKELENFSKKVNDAIVKMLDIK